MKTLGKIKTDDLSDDQKQLLSEFIKKEMITAIENVVNSNSSTIADAIKSYIRSGNEDSKSNS